MSTSALITHVLDGADTYYASTRSNKYVRGFGLNDSRSLYDWVKTQPHTVIVAENGSGKGSAMGSYNSSYGEIIEPDFDMKVQVSHTTNGISEVTVDRITYGVTTSGLGNGTNFTIKSPEHLHIYPSNIVYDETLNFNPPTITTTVLDAGSGYTSAGTDVTVTGGTGQSLKVSYNVDNGEVTDVTVTSDGTGYQDGDEVEIPGGTTNATLLIDIPGGVNTNSILYQIGQSVKNELDLKASKVSLGNIDLSKSFLGLTDTPSTYASNKPNLKLNDTGTALEFVGNNFLVDGEFRGMMNNLLHHKPYLQINAGDEHDITNISQNVIVWRTANNTIRYLKIADEYGAGGNDYFIRIDGGEPTCDGGGDYDPETNSCFPNTENVVAASTFQGVYDPNLADNASGSYGYSAKIRILKTGLYATGWIDVHQMYTDLNTAGANIASNDSDIANLQNDVATLQAGGGGGSAATYTKATLPLNGSSADLALVTDGTISGDPTMAYFYQGKWFRTLDNSEITDQTIDIYLLAGQSNAHGHADVSDLDEVQKTQDGLFYTSWHDNTSNASSTQYYSSWATSLVAGNTRGDSGSSTIGGSTMFGPEIGFVERANAINLTDGKPIGVLKHAIGASSLTDDGSADGGLSDWDLTATGDKRGDALRAFKLAITDGLTKLTNAGYSYRLAGFIWWQGESGGADSDLIAFIDHIRTWLDDNSYLSMPKAQFPFVITGTTDYWGSTYEANVANQDGYVGFVNTQDIAAPAWADRTLVHPGSNETYTADQNDINNGYGGSVGDSVGGPDFNNDGVNDMFAIGRAYADQMDLAKSGNTNSLWKPDDVELWLDASDTTTTTFSGSNLVSITDKNSDGSAGSNAFSATGNIVAGSENGLQTLTFEDDSPTATGGAGGLGSDYIQSSALASAMSSNNQIWFFAIKPINIGTDDSGASQYDGMFMVGAKTYLTSIGNFYESNQVLNSTGVLPNNEVSILAIQMNWATSGNNGTTSCWIDGTSVGTVDRVQSTNTNTPLASTGTSAWKFMMYNNGQNFLEGEFCEFIATDSLSDREKIEGYLAHKWGIESKLPAGHTYKTTAP